MEANLAERTFVDRLLKPEEVASLLSVSRSYAYRLLQIGEIPSVRLGKARRVRPVDLADFVERNLRQWVENN